MFLFECKDGLLFLFMQEGTQEAVSYLDETIVDSECNTYAKKIKFFLLNISDSIAINW